jgi:ubiquinone/menaquinone biosynthesis C-methylase UbiE
VQHERILEVGCGDGNLLARLNTTATRTGLDQSPAMLEVARQRSDEKIEYIEGDATRLPFDDGSFDLTYSSRCLINIQDAEMQFQAIREMIRVTAPGGSIILAENFTEGWEKLGKLRSRPWSIPVGDVGIQKQMDLDAVINLIRDVNCELVHWHQYKLTNLFYHGWLISVFRQRGVGLAERLFRPILELLTRVDTKVSQHRPLLGKDTTLHFIVRK